MNEGIERKRNFKIEETRKSLVQGGMKEIHDSLDTPDFYLRVFCVIAKFGLQNEACKEGIITYEEEPTFEIENKEQYLEKIHQFLTKYIR
jgi:hypothetical protein